MAQYFLISSSARKLSLLKIAKMSDDEALRMFANIRWHNDNPSYIRIVAMQIKFILSLQEMSINAMSVKRDLA